MEEKSFIWTSELTKKFLELRFENDWIFKKHKQPWRMFRDILLEKGFPEEMSLDHIRKKWSYTWACYTEAKKAKNKSWAYYKLFDKHFRQMKILDKYQTWDNEWRMKLIKCISALKNDNNGGKDFWKQVEFQLRSDNLPIDCCILDMLDLWHHLQITFNRKHRLKLKNSDLAEWPLYDAMLEYCQLNDPGFLTKLETETPAQLFVEYDMDGKKKKKYVKASQEDCEEFTWSREITETFIQLRFQNDSLFKGRTWAWGDLKKIMVEEHGFPKTLNSRELCRKWAYLNGEYQKAKAVDNKTWLYNNLFELYLGVDSSLNPIIGWQEKWVLNLISVRTELEHVTIDHCGWREVEMKLRSMGLPLDHSLLNLPQIWTYLLKTFRWKKKFAKKGLLNEKWPYYIAMENYLGVLNKETVAKQKDMESDVNGNNNEEDDYEDDIKLFDLKQRINDHPVVEWSANTCRSCNSADGCVSIFQRSEDDGLDLAYKLSLICDIEVSTSDNLPSKLCSNCVENLEIAYKFRIQCRELQEYFSNNTPLKVVKKEYEDRNDEDHHSATDQADGVQHDSASGAGAIQKKQKVKLKQKVLLKGKKKYSRYLYWKICEICGKNTQNLKTHMDTHSNEKQHSCDVCDKSFKYRSGLILHKAIHNDTPKKTCEICGKTFHILAQYRRHFVYHANERKFECESCGKRFNTMDILRVHRRVHTDERPFSCPDCGATFRTAGCVSRHRRIVHYKKKKNKC